MTLAEFEALSPQQKFFYDCAQHAEAEAYSKEMTMKMDAEAEGLAKGLAEGEHQTNMATAQNLIQMGLSDEQIAQATGLSIDLVESLR